MANVFHKDFVLDNNHALTARTYADVTARDSDTLFQVAENVDKMVRVDSPASFFILVSVGPAVWSEASSTGLDEFTELTDTPSTYVGQAGKVTQVNAAEDALEFGQALRTTDSPTFANLTITSEVNGDLTVANDFRAKGDILNFGASNDLSSLALGAGALINTTFAASNTAVGKNTLTSTTTGSNNTAVGSEALNANVTAGRSTAVGANALLFATGGLNTALGDAAGAAVTTGTNNLLLGLDADTTSPTASNQIVIGNASQTSTLLRGVVTAGTQLLVDNLSLDGSVLSTTLTDEDLFLSPNGTGKIQANGPTDVTGLLTVNGSAIADTMTLSSATQAFTNNRGTQTQRDAITAVAGMQFFNTTINDLEVYDGTSWNSTGGGDVVGPASAVDNAFARFNLTTGKVIQNSVLTLSDTGVIGSLSNGNIAIFPNGTGLTVIGSATPLAGQTLTIRPASGSSRITAQSGNGSGLLQFGVHDTSQSFIFSPTFAEMVFGTNATSQFGIAATGESTAYADLQSEKYAVSNTDPATIRLAKSGNATRLSHTAVVDLEKLGEILFAGSDGTVFRDAAAIKVSVNPITTFGDIGGFMEFQTSKQDAFNLTTKMSIDEEGSVTIGPGGVVPSQTPLSIRGQAGEPTTRLGLLSPADANTLAIGVHDNSNGGAAFVFHKAAKDLLLGTSDVTRVTIAADGDVDIVNALSVGTQITVDNLKLDGNQISATNVNGDVDLVPATGGKVLIGGSLRTLASEFSLFLESGGNNSITLTPGGTGSVLVAGTGLRINSSALETRVQIGDTIGDDNNRVYDTASLMIVHQTPTGNTALNDPQEVLYLARQGATGEAFGALATFKLSRYENDASNSRTRLDIDLTHGSFDDVNVMQLRSSGDVDVTGLITQAGNPVGGRALNETEVFALSDLPAPVGGVITLLTGNYRLMTDIDLGTNRIDIQDQGFVAFTSHPAGGVRLIYSGTDTMITCKDTETLQVNDVVFFLTGNNSTFLDVDNLSDGLFWSGADVICTGTGISLGRASRMGSGLTWRFSALVGWAEGITFADMSTVVLNTVIVVSDFGSTGTGITLEDTGGSASIQSTNFFLGATQNMFDFKPDVVSNVFVSIAVNGTGANFFKAGTSGAITSFADVTSALGTVTAVADEGAGDSRFTKAIHELEVGMTVVHAGFSVSAYNGTFRVLEVDTNTYVIDVDFGGTGTLGTVTKLAVRVNTTAHGLSDGDVVRITDTVDYNGGFNITEIQANAYEIGAAFVATETGNWNTDSLTQKSKFVTSFANPPQANSVNIGSYLADDNSTATTFSGSGVWTDLNLNGQADDGSNLEGFVLTNSTTGELTYIGLAPFSGIISFNAYVLSTGGAQDFEMRAVKNGSALVDTFEPRLNIGSTKVMFTVTVPVDLVTDDTIRPQVLRVSGTSSITVSHIAMITK